MPLAIGVQAAEPGRTVVAVLGDGGLEMGLGELGTLRDQGLRGRSSSCCRMQSLALIELKQRQAGLARAGVSLGRTDLPAIARAFGGHGVQVETAESLRNALTEAMEASVFTMVACSISASSYIDCF